MGAIKQQLKFTIEYIVVLEHDLRVELEEVLEKGRETGSCECVDVSVIEPKAAPKATPKRKR